MTSIHVPERSWRNTLRSANNPDHYDGASLPPSYQLPGDDSTLLDISQRIEQKVAQYNTSENVLKRWLFEILSWTTSAICIGSIIGICLYVRDQPLRLWPSSITVINVLTKIASACLILPISEAIGQLKWTWFNGKESKDIVDFEIFDKASRGAWGSFLLLFRTKGRSLAALGAILTLLLLATDTFFQQLVDLPERWSLEGHGEIPRSIRYTGDQGDIWTDGELGIVEDLNLRQVTFKYFYYNGNQPVFFGNGTRPDIPLSCPSGRCDWDPYESLGFCSACADVSHLLTFACLITKLDWISRVRFSESTYPTGTACGYWLNATSSRPVLMSGYRIDGALNSSSEGEPGEALLLRTLPLNTPITTADPFSATPPYGGSINFKDVFFPLVDALIVSAADGAANNVYAKVPPVAQECMISWCVKAIKSSYAMGRYEETITDTFFNTTARDLPYPWEVRYFNNNSIWTAFHGNISVLRPGATSTFMDFGVSNETYSRTASLFDDMFPSSITVANPTAAPWWRIKIYAWNYNQLRRVGANNPWLAPNNVTQYLEKFSTSMTNVIRSHSSQEFVQGRAYTETTFVAIRWGWIAFPCVLLLLCLVFLVATMIKTSKHHKAGLGMWKTSAMPNLVYGLPSNIQKGMPDQVTWGNAQSLDKRVRIRLLPKQGWRISGQTCVSPTLRSTNNQNIPPGWI